MGDENPYLLPCSICGRTFKPESLEKHYKACERNSTKKRKVFDSTMQRIQGTDLAEFLPNILDHKNSENISVNEKPEKLIEYSKPEKRKNTDVKVKNGVSPTSSKSSDNYEQCPHCERKFCLKAFDRHVEWCKEHRKPVSLSPDTLKAKEMLDARLKYQAPKHGKNKKIQPCEKNGIQSINHESKSTSDHFVNEFTTEKSNETARHNTKISRPRESLSAPSCNWQYLNSSEARPVDWSQRIYHNREIPKHFHNLQERFCENLKNMKIVNTDVIQCLTDAHNSMLCESGIMERHSFKESAFSKDSESSIENQEYFSAENLSVQTVTQTNSTGQNQLSYITDLCHASDAGSESSLSAHEEKASLSTWSVRQSVIDSASGIRKAKFCHECGAKFPFELAKFCCECGEQRLVIKSLSQDNT